jgi:carbonic anhydrase
VTPTARSLAHLRAQGYLAEVVERWIPGCNIRKDLFGFIDILAVRDNEVLGVQATSRDNVSARVAKIAEHENIAAVRKANIRLEVHGWGRMASGKVELRKVDCS